MKRPTTMFALWLLIFVAAGQTTTAVGQQTTPAEESAESSPDLPATEAERSNDAKSDDAKSDDAKSDDVETGDVETGDVETGDVEAKDADSKDAKSNSEVASPKYVDRFGEPIELHRPKNTPSESDFDRIHASALVAEARLLFQREDYATSLRRYQRAYRFASAKSGILREIVPLAFQLGRPQEAARYAVLAGPNSNVDPFVLRRLAINLTESLDYPKAIKLYQFLSDESIPESVLGGRVLTQFELGRLYFLTDSIDEAADAFGVVSEALNNPEKFGLDAETRNALLQNPAVTYGVIAETFVQSGKWRDAEACFRQAFEHDKNEPLLNFNLARVAKVRRDNAAVHEFLEKYIAAKAVDAGAQPYSLMAEVIRREEKDSAKANRDITERLETARQQDPSNVALIYALAKHYLELDRLEDSNQWFEELLAKQTSIDAVRGAIEISRRRKEYQRLIKLLGQVFEASNSLELIPDATRKISDDAPFNQELISIGIEKLAQNSRFENLALANVAIDSKKFDEAGKFYEAVIQSSTRNQAELLFAWGLDLLMANESKRSVEVLRRASNQTSSTAKKAELFYYLAGALAVENQTLEATAVAREAAKLQPKVLVFQFRPAWILYVGKKFPEAEQEYLRLISKYNSDFDNPGARDLIKDAHMTLSNICVAGDRIDEAVEWLERVLDEFPDDIGAHNDLGYLWADQNQHLQRALTMVQTAVAAEPDNFAYRDSLGWTLFRLGRFDESISELRRATDIDKPDGIVFDHLGDAYLASGQKPDAIEAWKKALEYLGDDIANQREKIEAKIEQQIQD